MKNIVRSAVLLAAMVTSPAVASAEPPDLSPYLAGSRQFFLASGATSFDVQFLFSRAIKNNSFFYQVDGGSWVGLFSIPGTNPTVPAAPPAGNPFTINVAASMAFREVRFAICEGFFANFASCGAPNSGPYVTGAGAPNVRGLTSADWNVARVGSAGLAPNANIVSVAGFEDTPVPTSDSDFSDVIIGTSLSRVVPEPSTYALMGAGLIAMAVVASRRRNLVS